MITAATARLATLLALLLAWGPTRAAAQNSARAPAQHSARAAAQHSAHPYDALLGQVGERVGTLPPTGRRLFAAELSPVLGLCGRFGYGDLAHGFLDPLRLELRVDGARVEPALERVASYPSHLAVTWRAAGLVLHERKLVSDDDELLDELVLSNEGGAALDVELLLFGDATPERERFLSRQVPVDLADSANLPPELEGPLGLAVARAGTLSYDGVRFALARPESDRPACVALRGGEDEATRELPDRAIVDVPDVAPRIATLHLLVAAPTLAPQVASENEGPAARFVLHLDDGECERAPWPVWGIEGGASAVPALQETRLEWNRLVLPGSGAPALRLSYDPPPGRFVRRVELEKLAGAAVPTLLAATFEVPPETGRLPVLLGTGELGGIPVQLALAGSDFAPARGPDGERALARRLQLEPGASATLRAVFATGPERPMTALRALDRVADEDAFARCVETHARWFEEQVPTFSCSDERLTRAWHASWYRARRSLMRLDLPDFSLPVFYRGLRDGADRIDVGDAQAVLCEVRWLRDPDFSQGQLRALLKLQRPDGLLTSVGPSGPGTPEPHGLASAALSVFEVHGREQLLLEALPGLARDVEATLAQRRVKLDRGTNDDEEATFLRLSARALTRGFEWVGDESEALRFAEIATRLESESDASETHVVTFLDTRDSLEPRRLQALAELVRRALRSPAVEDADAVAFALLTDAVGGAARRGAPAPVDVRTFRALLEELAQRKSADGELEGPFGGPFADLLIRYVGGVVPMAGAELVLDPLDIGLDNFRLDRVPYHGRSLTILWDRPDGARTHEDVPEGFTLLVDGAVAWHSPRLEPAHVRLPER